MFYQDRRAEQIGATHQSSIQLGGQFENISSYFVEKKVAKFKETFFISGNHTGMVSRSDALDKRFNLVMDGLSYRNRGANQNLDQDIIKILGRGERITMVGEKEPVIIIGGCPNYGHFVFEFLPKIVEGIKLFGNRYVFVINSSIAKWIDLANAISQGMIKEIPRFRIVPYGACIKSDNFIVIESTRAERTKYYNCKHNLKLVQKNSAKGIGRYITKSATKLYLRRAEDVQWRKIVNADAVRDYYRKRNFSVVEIWKLSQREQIALLKDCSKIVIEAGADSMATSLCPEGCEILELLPEGLVCGFGSASTHFALGHKYKRVYGKKVEENNGNLSIDYNYLIDIEKLDQG